MSNELKIILAIFGVLALLAMSAKKDEPAPAPNPFPSSSESLRAAPAVQVEWSSSPEAAADSASGLAIVVFSPNPNVPEIDALLRYDKAAGDNAFVLIPRADWDEWATAAGLKEITPYSYAVVTNKEGAPVILGATPNTRIEPIPSSAKDFSEAITRKERLL